MNDQQTPPKDIRVDMRFRNNLILAKMEGAGFKIVSELSRATGISNVTLGKLINMQLLPTTKDGQWRAPVLKLADFFKCLPEDLFSEFQQEHALDENRANAEMHFGEIQAMLASQQAYLFDPEAMAEAHELRAVLEQAISTLKPQYQEVLRARFGFDGPDMTLEEVGEKLGVSHARISEIEARALRSLRKPRHLIREAGGIDP